MPLVDGSHFSATPQPIIWKSYTEVHAGLLLGASLPPPPPYFFLRPNSLSSKANSRTSGSSLLRTCSPFPPRLLQPQCPGNNKRSLSTKEETLLEIILFFGLTTTLIPTCPPFPHMDCNPLHCFPLHSRLHRQQYSPTPVCFKQTIVPPPLLISKYGLTDLSPPILVVVVLECSHMLQTQHIQFPVLFHWSNCLQLNS